MELDNHSRKLSLLLFQEALWGIEDKLRVLTETATDHEIELLNIKRQLKEILTKLNTTNNHNE